jgi:hypothetical protein
MPKSLCRELSKELRTDIYVSRHRKGFCVTYLSRSAAPRHEIILSSNSCIHSRACLNSELGCSVVSFIARLGIHPSHSSYGISCLSLQAAAKRVGGNARSSSSWVMFPTAPLSLQSLVFQPLAALWGCGADERGECASRARSLTVSRFALFFLSLLGHLFSSGLCLTYIAPSSSVMGSLI